jgi:hypothetical protein
MERFARASERAGDRVLRERFLHEVREEAGHSLMFLELLKRSGVTVPPAAHPRSGFASAVGRLLPFPGALFWTLTVIGEELGDSLTRRIPGAAERVTLSAVVYHMARLHTREEAHHIAHTRAACAAATRGLPRRGRAALSPLVELAFSGFARRLYYPRPALYAGAGLPADVDWHGLARRNPARAAFAAGATAPTRDFLRGIGWSIRAPRAEPAGTAAR